MVFRRRATGSMDYTGIPPEVLKWKAKFEERLWADFWPFLCVKLAVTRVEYHYYSGHKLVTDFQWKLVEAHAREAARLTKVRMDVPATPGVYLFPDFYGYEAPQGGDQDRRSGAEWLGLPYDE